MDEAVTLFVPVPSYRERGHFIMLYPELLKFEDKDSLSYTVEAV
jgi:hypothetical protein